MAALWLIAVVWEYWYIVIPLFVLWLWHKARQAYYNTTGFHSERERQDYLRELGIK